MARPQSLRSLHEPEGAASAAAVHAPKTPALPPPKTPAIMMPRTPGLPPPKTPAMLVPRTPGLPPPKTPAMLVPRTPGLPPPKNPAMMVPRTPAFAPPKTPKLAFPQTPAGNGVVVMACALYDRGEQDCGPEDIAFREGEMLQVLEQTEQGWWLCRDADGDGREGWAPSNYLQLKGSPNAASARAAFVPKTPISAPVGASGSQFAVAVYDRPSSECEDSDLPFQEGDRLQVLSKDGDWWMCRAVGAQLAGLVPANFVQLE